MLQAGELAELETPAVYFTRLSSPVPVPGDPHCPGLRFLFVVFTPAGDPEWDHFEIGRSMAALFNDQVTASPDTSTKHLVP